MTADDGPRPSINFLGHASVHLEMGGATILTDPVLLPRVTFLGRISSRLVLDFTDSVDVVVISHLHHDHADVRSLRILPKSATLIVPAGAGRWARQMHFEDVVELPVGQAWQRAGAPHPLTITAVPAVHDGNRVPFGPRAEAIGYLIESGPASVYFAGDTDLYPEMAQIHPQLDVALLPVWGWGPNLGPGHMDPERAAAALELLQPKYAVPIHWGTLFPFGMRRLAPRTAPLLHLPPRHFAEHAHRIRPETVILHTEPGETVEFEP